MTAPEPPLLRHAPATVQGRYLVRPPRPGAVPRHHLIGFHGYAQTAEAMLESFERSVPAEDWLVVSVQALHTFYTARDAAVVASWMTRLDRDLAIASNVGYVDAVVDQLEREFGAPRRRVFAGFSQGVGMAFRAGALGRHRCDAIVSVGGDVPPELAAAPPRPWPVVLALAGERDTYHPPAALARDVERLRVHGEDVRSSVLDGGHAWSAEACGAVADLLRELAARADG